MILGQRTLSVILPLFNLCGHVEDKANDVFVFADLLVELELELCVHGDLVDSVGIGKVKEHVTPRAQLFLQVLMGLLQEDFQLLGVGQFELHFSAYLEEVVLLQIIWIFFELA